MMSKDFDQFINRVKSEMKKSVLFIFMTLRNPWRRIEEAHDLSWTTILLSFVLVGFVCSIIAHGGLLFSVFALSSAFAFYALIVAGTWVALLQFGPKTALKDLAEVGVIATIAMQILSWIIDLLQSVLVTRLSIAFGATVFGGAVFCLFYYHGLRKRVGIEKNVAVCIACVCFLMLTLQPIQMFFLSGAWELMSY